MRAFRWSVFCCVSAVGLLAAACTPSTSTPPTNLAPIAVISADPLSGTAPLEVEFSSAGSIDSDGSIVSYSWNFGDGSPTSSAPETTHTFAAGTHSVVLTVVDDDGLSDTATTTVTATGIANVPPVAVAAATPDTGTSPLEVEFSSAGSADSDGSILSYSWDFGDGSALSTEADPTHTYTAVGAVAATLTVTDDGGAVDTASVVVTVVPDQPPVAAVAATPTVGRAPLVVEFSSAGSTDNDGSVVSYSWDFGDGSAVSTEADPSHTYSTVGSFDAVLTVTDDDGLTDTAPVTIATTANQAPTAVLLVTPTSGVKPVEVSFDGTDSVDSDGSIVSYSWDFGDGSSLASTATGTHTFEDAGTFEVTLTVTDDEGGTDDASTSVVIDSLPNVAPSATLVSDVTSGKEPLTVAFDASGSTDSDGSIVSYSWDFGDGSALSTEADPTHTYLTAGIRTATVTVTDDDGATASATVQITTVPNQGPTAEASVTPSTGKAPLPVVFSSVGSADSDGSIVSYSWNFGDSTSLSTDPAPTHTYAAAGTYTATLTVTDDNGATDEAYVLVTATPNTAPTAIANADHQSGARPLTVHFTSDDSVDSDGSIVSYLWNFGDGDTATSADPTHVYGAGTWSATVTVTDDSGASTTSAAVTITAVIDDDADGVSPPADCNDSNGAINPGAADTLDDAGIDSNCDGYDGVVANEIFVAVTGGSDTGACGTPAAPCASIGQGQTRAVATGRPTVLVAGGSYGAFSVSNGVTIRGGYGQNFQRGSAATGSIITTINAAANGTVGGPTAVFADGLTAATRLADVTIQGGSAAAGQASYGVVVRNSGTAFTLSKVTVNGGTGGVGSPGSAGANALQTVANGGGVGDNSERSASACSTSRKNGGGGGTNSSVTGANGGNGGQGGGRDSDCGVFSFNSQATNGIGGNNAATVIGSNGAAGGGGGWCDCTPVAGTGGNGNLGRTQNGTGGGAGTATSGTISGTGFWAVSGGVGGSGTLGLDGTGGGGGGGGGGNDNGTDAMGAGGGGGGAGGARAGAVGTGGTSGAASIAIFVNNSTPTLTDVVVNLGNGGQGGAGGAGGLGQPGGPGGSGGTPTTGGQGGNGGAGGSGGNSGAGGGGAGGPAFGLLTRSGSVSGSGVTYSGGSGGSGGTGGTTGVTGTAGATGVRTTVASL